MDGGLDWIWIWILIADSIENADILSSSFVLVVIPWSPLFNPFMYILTEYVRGERRTEPGQNYKNNRTIKGNLELEICFNSETKSCTNSCPYVELVVYDPTESE